MDRWIQAGTRKSGGSDRLLGRGEGSGSGEGSSWATTRRCLTPRSSPSSATKEFNERRETGQTYTIFSNAQAAITRVTHDGCGSAQALARGFLAQAAEIHERGNTLSVRWTLSHSGVEGNEQADRAAKAAAEDRQGTLDPAYIAETSLSHPRRVTTERRASATQAWNRERVGRRHRYPPPPEGMMRKELGGTRKELAGRYYQLLSGHVATADHLVRVGRSVLVVWEW